MAAVAPVDPTKQAAAATGTTPVESKQPAAPGASEGTSYLSSAKTMAYNVPSKLVGVLSTALSVVTYPVRVVYNRVYDFGLRVAGYRDHADVRWDHLSMLKASDFGTFVKHAEALFAKTEKMAEHVQERFENVVNARKDLAENIVSEDLEIFLGSILSHVTTVGTEAKSDLKKLDTLMKLETVQFGKELEKVTNEELKAAATEIWKTLSVETRNTILPRNRWDKTEIEFDYEDQAHKAAVKARFETTVETVLTQNQADIVAQEKKVSDEKAAAERAAAIRQVVADAETEAVAAAAKAAETAEEKTA